jgi:hypothetical protein
MCCKEGGPLCCNECSSGNIKTRFHFVVRLAITRSISAFTPNFKQKVYSTRRIGTKVETLENISSLHRNALLTTFLLVSVIVDYY